MTGKTASGLSPRTLQQATTPLHRYGAVTQRLQIRIPEDPNEAEAEAAMLVAFTWGGNWGTAALVSSRTLSGAGQGRRQPLQHMPQRLSYAGFAGRGLRGLSDRATVKFYAETWESRFPKPEPGELVDLPDEPFPVRPPRRDRPDPSPAPPLPAGTFDVILADPPWQYDFAETESRAIENQYPTKDVEWIADLEVPAAPNAVLFCWATAPKLREGLQVVAGWGFEYVTHMVWIKDRIGMGYYARSQHELLLIGRRGTPGTPNESERPSSVFEAPRTEHSRKPDLVYDLVETMYPDRAYLELFARSGRDGWTSWGNEI